MRVCQKKFLQFILICALAVGWIFSGWPQIWHNLPFPPEVQRAEASHTTTFVFSSDAESWTYTDDNGSCSGAFTSGAGNPAGSVQTTGSKGGGATTCNAYWEWAGTWEDLGVTAGHEVTGISGAYEYAVSNDSSGGTWNTGPYELRDSVGTLRKTLVSGLTGQTGTASFTNRSGTEQTFTADSSDTTVRLRLHTVIAFGGGNKSWTGQNDNIAVTITHSVVSPTVTTNAASSVDTDSATLNGDITDDGGESGTGTQHGFVWGTDINLSNGDTTTTTLGNYSGTGTFNENISSLDPGETYYFRAYATNSAGTGYGSITNFTTDTLVYSVSITSSGSIEYGYVELSTASSTNGNGYTQTAENDGNTTAKFNVKSSDATGGITWTLASSIGTDIYKHEFSTTTGATWMTMPDNATYVTAALSVAQSGTVNFDFRLTVPSASTDYQQKSITITVQAVAP